MLAIAMVGAPVLLLAGTAILPAAIGDRRGDHAETLRLRQTLAPDRGRLPIGFVLVILGLGLLVGAAFGPVRLAHGNPLAVTGAVLGTLGAPAGIAINAVTALTAYRLTDPKLAADAAVDVYAGTIGPITATTFLLYLLVPVGLVLLAVAYWRTHALSWWPAALIGVGALLGAIASEGAIGPLATSRCAWACSSPPAESPPGGQAARDRRGVSPTSARAGDTVAKVRYVEFGHDAVGNHRLEPPGHRGLAAGVAAAGRCRRGGGRGCALGRRRGCRWCAR